MKKHNPGGIRRGWVAQPPLSNHRNSTKVEMATQTQEGDVATTSSTILTGQIEPTGNMFKVPIYPSEFAMEPRRVAPINIAIKLANRQMNGGANAPMVSCK